MGLHHVGILCEDLDKALGFYCGVLGKGQKREVRILHALFRCSYSIGGPGQDIGVPRSFPSGCTMPAGWPVMIGYNGIPFDITLELRLHVSSAVCFNFLW